MRRVRSRLARSVCSDGLERSKAGRLGVEERGQGVFGQFFSDRGQTDQDTAAVVGGWGAVR